MLRSLRTSLLLPLLPACLWAQGHAPPRKTRAVDGVYLFTTAPYSDVGLDGNSVAILSDDGVLVFDANGRPSRPRPCWPRSGR